MSFSLQDFNYELPPQLIAQTPAKKRDHSRLLCLRRSDNKITDYHFYDLPQILQQLFATHPQAKNGILIVRNDSQVIPARLYGNKSTGGKVEVLLTRQTTTTLPACRQAWPHSTTWESITKPGLKVGQEIIFDNQVTATCTQAQTNDYERTLTFNLDEPQFFAWLAASGHTPIPPYINANDFTEDKLRQVYQTTYATTPGSVAAPTAGLHFTPELTQNLQQLGVDFATVTLHVGPGTFLGVKTDDITKHHMHREFFTLTPENAAKINTAKKANKLILAVGTTTVRVLEHCVNENGDILAQTGSTEIFIYPPYKFKIVGALITNFHLPKSTLLMLVSALMSAPNTADIAQGATPLPPFINFAKSSLGQAYAHAIAAKYRFFSFGDAMLII